MFCGFPRGKRRSLYRSEYSILDSKIHFRKIQPVISRKPFLKQTIIVARQQDAELKNLLADETYVKAYCIGII